MEEKIIIKGERGSRLILKLLSGIAIGIILIGLLSYANYVDEHRYSIYWQYGHYSLLDGMTYEFQIWGIIIDIGIFVLLISLFLWWWLSFTQLTVTDKRVYGKAAFGKRVDLPIDSVSSVGMSFPKGISIGTSSGKIAFALLKNQADIHSAISQLLIERQMRSEQAVNQSALSTADELKKYKELLDSGVITQEEFDAKKKQLLGL